LNTTTKFEVFPVPRSSATTNKSNRVQAMDGLYLIRLVQVHESFRKPELEALALLGGVKLEFVEYSPNVSRGFFPSNIHHPQKYYPSCA
jgi:hypothetical protein